MAQNSQNQSGTSAPSGPPSSSAPAPHAPASGPGGANPNPNVEGGISAMSRYAAHLSANFTINKVENNRPWPTFFHKILPAKLLILYRNILHPLVYEMHRPLGASTTSAAADVTFLADMTSTLAYDAIIATYSCMYNKATKTSTASLRYFTQMPTTLFVRFPIYIVALATSIGPLQLEDIPFRGLHIPYLSWSDIVNVRPPGYQAFYSPRFAEAVARAKTLTLGEISTLSTTSSPWWTFHATTNKSQNIQTTTTFSPVKYADTNSALKLAIAFIGAPIVELPGPVNYSVSRYYFDNEIEYDGSFPNSAFVFPEFILHQPAFYHKTDTTTIQVPSQSSLMIESGESSSQPPSKRRAAPHQEVETFSVNARRLIFYYFDHVSILDLNINELDIISRELNAA